MDIKIASKRKRISLNDEIDIVPDTPPQPQKNNKRSKLISKRLISKMDNKNSIELKEVDKILADIDFTDFDDFNQAENSAKKQLDLTSWARCLIQNIEKDPKNWDVILTLSEDSKDDLRTTICRLQGPWSNTKISIGEIVSIQATWNEKFQSYCISSESGLIVTNPDYLISGTSVVGSLFCQRKGVLSDRFTGIDRNSKIMTFGSLIHEIFQIVIKRKLSTHQEIEIVCREILGNQSTNFTLYASEITSKEAWNEIEKFIPTIEQFIKRYIEGNNVAAIKDTFCDKIDSITDIEENIWIPQLGLKGKVDVTVNVRRRNNFFKADLARMPLEIKTGKPSFSSEHRGQVFLYQMMMREIGQQVNSGLLLYLRDGIMKEITMTRNDQRDLIMLRNELAFYLNTNSFGNDFKDKLSDLLNKSKSFQMPILPEPINHHSACASCPYNTICCAMLSRDKTIKLSEINPLEKIKKEILERLTPDHIDYLIHWTGLLSLEEMELKKENQLKSMWTETPEQREKNGYAITNLIISEHVECDQESYLHVFTRDLKGLTQNTLANDDLSLCGLNTGEYLRVSANTKIAVAAGRVIAITKTSITMSLERNLNNRYKNCIFTLDKHNSNHFVSFNLANLGALMDDRESSNKLRKIVIDRCEPTFVKTLPKIIANQGRTLLASLNKIQQKAILKALTANDYMLLKGLPGTGKTQTLVNLICLFVLMGKSIIITSHTNSAVDNVLLRLLKYNIDFIRLGSSSSISHEINKFRDSVLTKNCKTPEDFTRVYEKYDVVGVTCLSSSHPVLIQRKFDVCLVDEATQVMQCTTLRPLMSAEKFILVGDPEQLPPLIVSKEARILGADKSLFARLDSESATAILTMQYRMNETITKLANQLTYNGTLKCATETVSKSTIKLPNIQILNEQCRSEKWLLKTLSTHLDLSVLFLNTENIFEKSLEFAHAQQQFDMTEQIERNFTDELLKIKQENQWKKDRIYTNYCEAAVILYLIDKLIQGGFKGTSIGIIATYRAQVELLKQIIGKYEMDSGNPNKIGIEVNTVDQYQGRDKEIIFYSCTKSSNPSMESKPKNKTNEILEDHRRLTVAITRSKYKLIMIGDKESLDVYTPFQKLFQCLTGMSKINLKNGNLGFSWSHVMDHLSHHLTK